MVRNLDASWELPPKVRRADVIATSPDGQLVAAQWGHFSGAGHAAVWDVATKKIVWQPEGATSLCWIGKEVLVTRLDTAKKREVIDSYDATSRTRIATHDIRYPVGAWLTHGPQIVGSPTGTMAAVRWLDQTEAGFEILRKVDSGWDHVASWSYRIPCNVASAPWFNDTGEYLAMVWANPRDPFDWWLHPGSDGTHLVGVAAVMSTRDGAVGNLPYFTRPPAGWEPDPRRSPAPEIVGFRGDSLEVELQTGEHVVRSVTEVKLTPPPA